MSDTGFGAGPIRAGHELDWPSLAEYLREHLDVDGRVVVAEFHRGSTNINYLVAFDHRLLVVRRPPFGYVPPAFSDLRREHHILSRLWSEYPRAPRSLLLCTDESVIGSDFVVHDLRVGEVIWQDLPESLASEPDAGRRIGFAVVDALADLHMVDPDSCGLGDVDTGEGFIDRQLDGWRYRWAEVADDDFDPLMDVGILLDHWPDPSDTAHDHAIVPSGQYDIGMPTRTEMVKRYCARTGVDPARITWYEAFAAWRTAIGRQIEHRHHFGSRSQDPTAPQSIDVPVLIGRARRLLEEASA